MNRATAALLARSSASFFRRHPAQLALSFIGIMLGVGIVTAVLITNASARRAFALSSDTLYGRSTHQLFGADGVANEQYADLRSRFPELAMAPVREGQLALAGELFSLIGLDPFAEAGFGRAANGGSLLDTLNAADGAPLADILLDDDAVAISGATRDRLALPLDTPLDISVDGRDSTVRIVATLETDNPAATEGLLLADIATAQELLMQPQTLSRIDLRLTPSERDRLESSLPPTLQLREAAAQEQTMRAMTRGFQINLTAMSLLALVVGAFLIHNTMTFAVLQRRELFANLRMAGVSSRSILITVLAEALTIGLSASLAGVVLGFVLAQGLIKLTTRTINDLYFVLHVQEIWFSPWLAIGGLLLGVGASVLAATISARDAAATSPMQASRRSLTESQARDALPRFALFGVVLLSIGGVLAFLPARSLLSGFAALILLIAGYAALIPWLVHRAVQLLARPVARASASFAHATGSIERNISRTGVAIAALAVAVSATFGVEIMITSFRISVDEWLRTTLQSDIYLSAPTSVASQASTVLDPRIAEIVTDTPGIDMLSTGRVVDVATSVGQIDLLVLDPHTYSASGFEVLVGQREEAWRTLQDTDSVLISEPLATKHGLMPGDTLSLFTEKAGARPFSVAAIVRDYGSSHGRLTMLRNRWERWWDDDSIASLGIMVNDTSSVDTVLMRLRARLSAVPQALEIRSNEAIHAQSLAVFDRTFEVTRVLRWLTVGVAFIGIFSALLALHLERAREFAILRACGATRGQVGRMVAAQTALMGLLAGLLALPLGWGMSAILIHIINLRSFGWSMQSHFPPAAALSALFLACLSAILAGVWPAWRLARADVSGQLRDE